MKAIFKIIETADDGVYYLLKVGEKRDGSPTIELRSRADGMLPLSWITQDAAALRYALEECDDADRALVLIDQHAGSMRTTKIWRG